MSRSSIVAGLALISLIASGCTGSSSTHANGTAAPSASGSTTSSVSGQTDAPPATDVTATLAAAPTFVHPLINAAFSSSAIVTSAAGGDISLDLPTAEGATPAKAILHIPAGAVTRDTRITLIAVDDLDSTTGTSDAPTTWHGVEIAPNGLTFAPGHFPTLTFTNVDPTFISTTWGWDSDGVVSIAPASMNSAGSVTIATPHFSGYGGGASPASAPSGPIGAARATIAKMLGADQAAQLLGNEGPTDLASYTKVIDQLHDSYIVALMKAAAQQCGGGLEAAVREWLGVEQMAQIFGSDGYDVAEVSPVVHKMIDCARSDCKAGDETAGGRFFHAVVLGSLLGVFSDAEEATLNEEVVKGLSQCTSWKLFAAATLDISIGGYPLDEHFLATGVVHKDGETIIPMHVTTRHADTIPSKFLSVLAQGFGSAMGVSVPNDAVTCSISAFGPSAARVVAGTVAGTASDTAPIPSITIGGLVAPATISCGELHWDDPTYFVFLMPAMMSGITIADLGFQHNFTEEEHDGLHWSFSGSAEVPAGLGITGHEELVIGLTPVVTPDPTPVVPPATAGLHDWGTGLRAAMS